MNTSKLSLSVATIFERDLKKVIHELNQVQEEKSLWILDGSINNTAGNLALHIAGAVNHFIGAVLGKNGYIRNRAREFEEKNVPKDDIISKLNQAVNVVIEVMPRLTEADMEKEFPEKIGGNTFTIGFFLVHLVSHINYHLGQINYHRRILEK